MEVVLAVMEDTVDLGDYSPFPSSQVPHASDVDRVAVGLDTHSPLSTADATASRHGRAAGRACGTRSLSGPSPAHSSLPHKLRGPNWTEAEMLVLIGEKRVEWDGRHNCSQPSLTKFVYGTTAWRLVLAGCMAVPSFRVRDADQLTNKWV